MADSRNAGSSFIRQHRTVALGVALVIVGLLVVFAFPSDRLPWQAKGYTQAVPDCGATTDTIVCIQPPSQVAETGAQFTVDVVADKVTNLGAYEFTLAFDPAVVSFVSVANGAFLGSTGRSVNCLGPFPEAGSVRFACVTLGSEPGGPTGTGLLARVKFSALAAGASTLDLTKVILADVSGTPLPHTDIDGQVTVIEGPTATPCPGGVCPTSTPTPVPTDTPTPSAGPTIVRVDPASQGQLSGSVVTVAIAVDAVTNLGAYEFTLAFNSDVLEFVSVSNGSFLGSSGRTVFCPPPTIGANTVRFGCVTSGSTPDGPSGSGVLSSLVFLAANPGTSSMHLFSVGLANPRGVSITTAVEDGTVTVTLASTPTPTPCPDGICPTATITPTPTTTATPTATPLPVNCAVEPGATVCVQPPDFTVPPGTDFSIDVVVDEVSDLGGYEFTLVFDPDIIALMEISNGSFLGSTGRTVSCLDPTLGVGSVRLVCTTLGAAPGGPNGSGVLATVRFLALAEGSSPLHPQDVILADILGTSIPSTAQDGAVTVSSGPTPTPPPTSTPTSTSTPGPSPTPGGTLVRVDPSSQTVSIGDNFGVDIRIENVENLGSYEWLLTFDPAVLDYVSVSNGSFLGSTGRTVFCPGAILDTGSVRFGCSTAGTTPPGPSGAGVLATITFSALATGTSSLDLVWAQLSDPLAEDIPTAIQDGDVTVVEAPTATATLTATPTLEASSSLGSTDDLGGVETAQHSDPRFFLVSRLLGGFIAAVGASIAWYGRPRTERR
jgi:Cohesin domain